MHAVESAEEDNLQPVAGIASLLDVSIRRVQQLVADGVLPKARHGKYPVIACIQAYIRHLRELSEGASAAAERAKLLKAQRQKVEIEVASMRRDLIPAEEVRAVVGRSLTNARAILLAIERRVKTEFGQQAADMVREEHDRALEELARGAA